MLGKSKAPARPISNNPITNTDAARINCKTFFIDSPFVTKNITGEFSRQNKKKERSFTKSHDQTAPVPTHSDSSHCAKASFTRTDVCAMHGTAYGCSRSIVSLTIDIKP